MRLLDVIVVDGHAREKTVNQVASRFRQSGAYVHDGAQNVIPGAAVTWRWRCVRQQDQAEEARRVDVFVAEAIREFLHDPGSESEVTAGALLEDLGTLVDPSFHATLEEYRE